ncbi:VOC family protein [Nocardioides alcanivorans]|uniref:VOC family protein n=1 Tax=Nocardioides alcanivorans TaxID=2897352 RepID=UPI001F22BFAC|nr:VOC family protein [Nocardioides alcanivorans]
MEIIKPALDLGVTVTDMDTSLAFYRDLLGLDVIAELPSPGGQMVLLAVGESQLKLVSPKKPATGSALPGGISAGVPGMRYFTFTISDLDATVESCREAGRPVVVEPVAMGPSMRLGIVEDPDGNWVEFLEPVA